MDERLHPQVRALLVAMGVRPVGERFQELLVGQLVLVVSRAAFWPATWAMASELPGHRGIQLGRLNAVTNVGQIAGSALCGFLLAAAGFDATFATLAATGLLAFIAGLATRAGPAKRPAPHRRLLSRYGPLLRQPIILYSMICAYLSALPFSLSMSFYPLLLAEYGYGEETSGVIVALRAIVLGAKERVPTAPDVPTTAEVGMPDILIENWYGMVAPAATPPDVITKLGEST